MLLYVQHVCWLVFIRSILYVTCKLRTNIPGGRTLRQLCIFQIYRCDSHKFTKEKQNDTLNLECYGCNVPTVHSGERNVTQECKNWSFSTIVDQRLELVEFHNSYIKFNSYVLLYFWIFTFTFKLNVITCKMIQPGRSTSIHNVNAQIRRLYTRQ